MLTADAIKYAKKDGAVYTSSFGDYDPKKGFVFNDYGKKCLKSDPDKFVKMLFSDDTVWSVKPIVKQLTRKEVMERLYKAMSKEEIEKKLGYAYEITPTPATMQKSVKEYDSISDALSDLYKALTGDRA